MTTTGKNCPHWKPEFDGVDPDEMHEKRKLYPNWLEELAEYGDLYWTGLTGIFWLLHWYIYTEGSLPDEFWYLFLQDMCGSKWYIWDYLLQRQAFVPRKFYYLARARLDEGLRGEYGIKLLWAGEMNCLFLEQATNFGRSDNYMKRSTPDELIDDPYDAKIQCWNK